MRGKLTLKRKQGESIDLTIKEAGLYIKVTLVEVDKNQAYIRIEAPKAVRIMRTELKD